MVRSEQEGKGSSQNGAGTGSTKSGIMRATLAHDMRALEVSQYNSTQRWTTPAAQESQGRMASASLDAEGRPKRIEGRA